MNPTAEHEPDAAAFDREYPSSVRKGGEGSLSSLNNVEEFFLITFTDRSFADLGIDFSVVCNRIVEMLVDAYNE